MAGSLELEPTAALVMDWARDLYRTGSASAFYARLDLSAGHLMREECDRICPWYPEVMMNRKWFIRHLASLMVSQANGPCQVILLAAGKSPLALELLDSFPEKIAAVFETDIAGMEEKQQLYHEVAPDSARKIRCVPADLYDRDGTADAIMATGMYHPDRISVIVFEGISYYLPAEITSGILSAFTSRFSKNSVILDYLSPCRLVREDRRYISRGIWGIIHRDCQSPLPITYSPDDLEGMLSRSGCSHIQSHTMDEMEYLRRGKSE
jgi:O-methyltransferase involved in polyketide biosynthesis